jgi:hypothetical protein
VPADAHRPGVNGLLVIVALVVSAGYAVAAASTTPFTWAADVLTAIPIALVTIGASVLWPAHPDRASALVEDGRPRPRHPFLGWAVLLGVVAGWEVAEYLWRGSRSAHPTLSSMADAFDAHAVGKAVAFLAWLLLGAAIVRAGGAPVGSRVRSPEARSS